MLNVCLLQRVQGIAGPKKGPKAVDTTGKSPRFYPADDIQRPLHSRKKNLKPTKIRASIQPGTILILLAGRFRGKRVVFLKALESGLLLVSGPFKINGVPLRRVSQTYVIATSTRVDVSNVDVSDINDEYFSRDKESTSESEAQFFKGDAPKPAIVTDKRKADQKRIDAALLKSVEAVPMLRGYLNAKFSLTKSDRPHLMVF